MVRRDKHTRPLFSDRLTFSIMRHLRLKRVNALKESDTFGRYVVPQYGQLFGESLPRRLQKQITYPDWGIVVSARQGRGKSGKRINCAPLDTGQSLQGGPVAR